MVLVIVRDMAVFTLILVVITFAFAIAFFILNSEDDEVSEFSTIPRALLQTFVLMLGDTDVLNTFNTIGNRETESVPG